MENTSNERRCRFVTLSKTKKWYFWSNRDFTFANISDEHVEVLLEFCVRYRNGPLFCSLRKLNRRFNSLALQHLQCMHVPSMDGNSSWKQPLFTCILDRFSWAFRRCWSCLNADAWLGAWHHIFDVQTGKRHTVLVCRRCEKCFKLNANKRPVILLRGMQNNDVFLCGNFVLNDFGVSQAWQAFTQTAELVELHTQVWRRDDNNHFVKLYKSALLSFTVLDIKLYLRVELTKAQTTKLFGCVNPRAADRKIGNARFLLHTCSPATNPYHVVKFFHRMANFATRVDTLRNGPLNTKLAVRSFNTIPECCHGEAHMSRCQKWTLQSCGACDHRI